MGPVRPVRVRYLGSLLASFHRIGVTGTETAMLCTWNSDVQIQIRIANPNSDLDLNPDSSKYTQTQFRSAHDENDVI